MFATSAEFFNKRFLPVFSPVALVGLLYTIIVLFAYQGKRIIHNLGPVFRVFVPQILYFLIMWLGTFFAMNWLARREKIRANKEKVFTYEIAVTQAFTAASNNFVRLGTLKWLHDTDNFLNPGTRNRCCHCGIWCRLRAGFGCIHWPVDGGSRTPRACMGRTMAEV